MAAEVPPVPTVKPEDADPPVQTSCSPLTFIGLFWAFVIEVLVGGAIWLIWKYCF